MDLATPVAVKVPKESPGYAPTAGLSFPLRELMNYLPGCCLYWQVRNPLDAIASLRVGISKDWGHHPRPPDWEAWLDRRLLERCAHHCGHINSVGYCAVEGISLVTRFENLIEDPMAFALGVSEQVGLASDSFEDDLGSWADRVQNTNNEKFVEGLRTA